MYERLHIRLGVKLGVVVQDLLYLGYESMKDVV
jgi:hypothetical protein